MRLLRFLIVLIKFIFFYLKTLIHANLIIALDVLTPGLKIEPGFIEISLRTRSDFEILVFSNLITMTPGTLSFDVSKDQKRIFVHALYLKDPEKVRSQLGEHLQNRVLEVLRQWK